VRWGGVGRPSGRRFVAGVAGFCVGAACVCVFLSWVAGALACPSPRFVACAAILSEQRCWTPVGLLVWAIGCERVSCLRAAPAGRCPGGRARPLPPVLSTFLSTHARPVPDASAARGAPSAPTHARSFLSRPPRGCPRRPPRSAAGGGRGPPPARGARPSDARGWWAPPPRGPPHGSRRRRRARRRQTDGDVVDGAAAASAAGASATRGGPPPAVGGHRHGRQWP